MTPPARCRAAFELSVAGWCRSRTGRACHLDAADGERAVCASSKARLSHDPADLDLLWVEERAANTGLFRRI